MRKILLIATIFLSGCSFMIKTPVVANYENLEKIDSKSNRSDVSILLGSPQGAGIYGSNEAQKELQFYYGFAGKFTSSGADYDSGTAFISYVENKPVDLIYFKSKITGHEISFKNEFDIKLLANSLQLGKSHFEDIVALIGKPSYEGKRINFDADIYNKVGYWDASEVQQKGAMKEKWLLVGYDEKNIVQDLIWVSSKPEDIESFGKISELQIKQMSRFDMGAYIPMLETTGLAIGNKIDPVQVEALVRSKPKNVKDLINVIGKPTALGIKSFQGNNTFNMSNWSFVNLEIKGKESNFIPTNATEEQRKELSKGSFQVMNFEQSRLMVSHKANGDITEILWIKPIK